MIDTKKLQRAFKHTFNRITAIEQELEIIKKQQELMLQNLYHPIFLAGTELEKLMDKSKN